MTQHDRGVGVLAPRIVRSDDAALIPLRAVRWTSAADLAAVAVAGAVVVRSADAELLLPAIMGLISIDQSWNARHGARPTTDWSVLSMRLGVIALGVAAWIAVSGTTGRLVPLFLACAGALVLTRSVGHSLVGRSLVATTAREATERVVGPGAALRCIDIVGATAALLVGLPVLALTAVAVKLHDGGPVLFRHQRVGKDGRMFSVIKFRTMRVDAEDLLTADPELRRRYVENQFKLPADDDPRISRLGRFLRSTSIDELPQLWNVLLGDMALVGPRPVVPAELREYADRGADAEYRRHRPGLTGLWQVSGRSHLDYDQRVALDMEYLRHPSLGRTLAILARTPGAVLRREGAH